MSWASSWKRGGAANLSIRQTCRLPRWVMITMGVSRVRGTFFGWGGGPHDKDDRVLGVITLNSVCYYVVRLWLVAHCDIPSFCWFLVK